MTRTMQKPGLKQIVGYSGDREIGRAILCQIYRCRGRTWRVIIHARTKTVRCKSLRNALATLWSAGATLAIETHELDSTYWSCDRRSTPPPNSSISGRCNIVTPCSENPRDDPRQD